MGNKKIASASAAIIFIILCAMYFFKPSSIGELKTAIVKVGNLSIRVEIASSDKEKELGLSGRDFLAQDSGMLFIYNDSANRDFWMKDMKFPIDVLWIDKGKIVDIQENIQMIDESGNVVKFSSQNPADSVLEIPAGWILKNQVKIGDSVDIVRD